MISETVRFSKGVMSPVFQRWECFCLFNSIYDLVCIMIVLTWYIPHSHQVKQQSANTVTDRHVATNMISRLRYAFYFWPFLQISSPGTCIGILIYISIYGGLEMLYGVVGVLRQCLSMYVLIHALAMPDFSPISIQISFYTNVRKSFRYYNMFKSISFYIYNVYSCPVIWSNKTTY